MSARTRLLQLLPWEGGLNTNLDESMLAHQSLTVADNTVFGERLSRKKRDGINHDWDDASDGSDKILAGLDFWFGSTTKTQRQVAVSSARAVYSYNAGTRSTLSESTKSITNVSVANPTVITSTAHGLTTGDQITIAGTNTSGTTVGNFTVTVITSDTFSIPVNVTSVTTGTGTWVSRTWAGTLTQATITPFNNLAIVCVDGSNNPPKKWDGTTFSGLLGNPPQALAMREHLGRLFATDKENVDLLHYSPVHDHTLWRGLGDSGGIPIGVGDGDPDGLTCIFPTFRGDLFVAKRTKLYRIQTPTNEPADWVITKVSDTIGCVGPNAVASADLTDIYFWSERGLESLVAVQEYGDYGSIPVSQDIQKTVNDDLSRSRFKFIELAYLPTLNSVACAVTESSALNRSLTTSSVNNTLYMYRVPMAGKEGRWYRWYDLPCSSVWVASDSDKKRLYLGTHTTRVSKTLNGTNYDVSSAGAQTAIRWRVASGIIFPTGNPYDQICLKRFILYYKPQGTHTFSGTIKIDNQTVGGANQLSFSETSSGALLGSTFVLGSSALGYDIIMGPASRTVDGVGHGFKVTLEQTTIDQSVEIQGFAVEYETGGTQADTVATSQSA